jgi:hypothetical protein
MSQKPSSTTAKNEHLLFRAYILLRRVFLAVMVFKPQIIIKLNDEIKKKILIGAGAGVVPEIFSRVASCRHAMQRANKIRDYRYFAKNFTIEKSSFKEFHSL